MDALNKKHYGSFTYQSNDKSLIADNMIILGVSCVRMLIDR